VSLARRSHRQVNCRATCQNPLNRSLRRKVWPRNPPQNSCQTFYKLLYLHDNSYWLESSILSGSTTHLIEIIVVYMDEIFESAIYFFKGTTA
jgi:hypothetical protein